MLSYGEKLLRAYLKRCFPEEAPVFNCRSLGIVNPETGFPLEIDIYYPGLGIGFEFNGKQHKSCIEQRERDKSKRKQCKEKRIELFEIWTATLEQDIYKLIVERIPGIKITKPKRAFINDFLQKAVEYKKNIYSMNKEIKSSTFINRRKKYVRPIDEL